MNKDLLFSGLQRMAMAVFFIFSGPSLFTFQEQLWNKIVGGLLIIVALFFIGWGLRTILQATFND